MNRKMTIAFYLISVVLTTASAQSVSEKRSFMKSLPVNEGTRLEVYNKYGDINITSWNKDSVYIMAEVEAFAPNQSRLRKMFEGIEININDANQLVRARTEFNQSIIVLLESFKGLTEKIIEYESRVKINYFINAPDYLTIKIENQFGDVNLENNRNDVAVSLSNGNFEVNSLNRLSELKMNFGDGSINSVNTAKINTSFSELTINESKNLTVNSTSSRFNLKKAEKVNVESRRDKFFIGDILQLDGISYFTDYKLENLQKEVNLNLKYGGFSTENIDNRFDRINLTSAYSDITLSFVRSASYNLEIRHLNAFVVIPDNNAKTKKEVLNEDKKEYITSGTIGDNPGTRKVRIDATRGNIYLR